MVTRNLLGHVLDHREGGQDNGLLLPRVLGGRRLALRASRQHAIGHEDAREDEEGGCNEKSQPTPGGGLSSHKSDHVCSYLSNRLRVRVI